MSTDLAPIAEPALPADIWARSATELNDYHFNVKGRISQAELDQLEAEFLAKGGEIQAIPTGVSGEDSSQFNNRTVAVNPVSQFSTAEQRQHARERTEKVYAADAELVAAIAVNLPAVQTARQLCQLCKCHADRLDRILRTYFADDAMAKPFIRISREEREAKIIREYPQLINQMSQSDCAKALHVHHCELKRIVALHRLKPAPTAAQVWNNPNRPATRQAAEAAA